MKLITRSLNQQFAQDSEAALSSIESAPPSLMEWARLLEMRSGRLVNLLKVNVPAEIVAKELDLAEQALDGTRGEFHATFPKI